MGCGQTGGVCERKILLSFERTRQTPHPPEADEEKQVVVNLVNLADLMDLMSKNCSWSSEWNCINYELRREGCYAVHNTGSLGEIDKGIMHVMHMGYL